MGSIVDRWNAVYFDNRLSAGALDALANLSDAGADAQALADRIFRLMRVARFDAADLSAFTAWLIGFGGPRTVPSAWDGEIPPVTMSGRNRKLDDYVLTNAWHRPGDEPVLVDLGCGCPPFTAVDSAATLIGWRVIGVEPAFSRYLVYDEQDDYACFDDEQHLRYFQPGIVDPDPVATRAHFRCLLNQLLPLLPQEDTDELHEVHRHGARLVRNPIRRYETDNLVLTQGEIGSFELEGGADVIRCMNVLMYFDHAFRQRALQWATGLLRPGGLFICGSNWAYSTNSRYTVYQKQGDQLVAREFALGIGNVRPLGSAPWYALYDDNLENLCNAEAVGIIRNDDDFRRRFDERLDELLAHAGLCRRDTGGYLSDANEDLTVAEIDNRIAELVDQLDDDGFVDDAVDVLRRAGRRAWRNRVGHVAMQPVPPHPLAPSAILGGKELI